MTRDTCQQSWYTGVVLITKLDHYLRLQFLLIHFWAFEMIPNPHDTAAPLMLALGYFSNFEMSFSAMSVGFCDLSHIKT